MSSRQLHQRFLKLPLFDDLYLRMQALNIAISDQALRGCEHALLREYLEQDSTPMESAAFVSAFSQLWLFGLYELLRTWRDRANEILEFVEKTKDLSQQDKDAKQAEKRKQLELRTGDEQEAEMRWKPFRKATTDPEFPPAIARALDCSEALWRRLEALRVNIAKHEVPRSKGGLAMSPGYGRIDESTGSIYWQIDLGDKEVDIVSRQRIAELLLRDLSSRCRRPFLPRAVRPKLQKIERFAYGTRQCTVILDDNSRYDVVVRWNEIVFARDRQNLPLDPARIVNVVPCVGWKLSPE